VTAVPAILFVIGVNEDWLPFSRVVFISIKTFGGNGVESTLKVIA
jgi:hypothetical protein